MLEIDDREIIGAAMFWLAVIFAALVAIGYVCNLQCWRGVVTLVVRPPWFDLMADRKKTVEGRLQNKKYDSIAPGDIIEIRNADRLGERFRTRVAATRYYPSFRVLLVEEGLDRVLPGIRTIEEGIKIYRQFYTETEENMLGAFAIELDGMTIRY